MSSPACPSPPRMFLTLRQPHVGPQGCASLVLWVLQPSNASDPVLADPGRGLQTGRARWFPRRLNWQLPLDTWPFQFCCLSSLVLKLISLCLPESAGVIFLCFGFLSNLSCAALQTSGSLPNDAFLCLAPARLSGHGGFLVSRRCSP